VREAFGTVTITNSSFQGTVTGGSGGNSWAGAFIGEARGNLTITDSYFRGTVAGGPGSNPFAGGFVGNAILGSQTLSFRRNYMTGSVIGGPATNAWAGGFFGQFGFQNPGSIIENSFVRATVTSGPGTGAVANGFVGDATSGFFTLSKSYFEGSLTGSGSNASQPILGSGSVTPSSVFCVSSCGTAGIGTAKASLSLLKSSVATDSWDFTNTWCYSYGHNDGYPVLKGLTYGPNAAWGNCVPEPSLAPAPAPETTTTSTTSTTTTSTTVACQIVAVQKAASGSVISVQPGDHHIERDGRVVKSGVSGSAAVANDTLQVRERGIAPGASVDVWLVGGRHFLGTLTADSSGSVRGRLNMPDSVKSGDNTVQMIERNCNSVGHVVSLGLRLPISETLPSTGTGLSPFTWLSGLMAIATGLLLKRKRALQAR
jgi:LPXTG-motif cell wall-anchored protein